MPSPIAHITAGYVVYILGRSRAPRPGFRPLGPLPGLLVATAGLSLLPDLDSVVGVLAGDIGRFHNGVTHSLFVGLGVAFAFAMFMRWRRGAGFMYWFTLSLLCYQLHIVMDSATLGRGVMALWPFSASRYHLTPAPLFYGFHWSDGWISLRHLWTLVTELGFGAFVVLIVRVILPRIASQIADRSRSGLSRD
jgi:membrane-bound metal-dependent hydrolase YbcI (DUF457 family)